MRHGHVDDLAMLLDRPDAHPIGKRGAQHHCLSGNAKEAAVEVIEVSIGDAEWDDFHLETFGGPGQGVALVAHAMRADISLPLIYLRSASPSNRAADLGTLQEAAPRRSSST